MPKGFVANRFWLACVLGLLVMVPSGVQAQVTDTVLHSFGGFGFKGYSPQSGVFRDAAGNLYGTAQGGAIGYGVVYKLDTTGHQSVLHSFTGGPDGANVNAAPGVVVDSGVNVYGATQGGGAGFANSGSGVVFKIDAAGHETVLHTFRAGQDGAFPNNVILDAAGNLYGTTESGGPHNAGVIFKVDATGHYSVLYGFKGGTAGSYPEWGVTLDAAGNLYGTAERVGAPTCTNRAGCDLIYRLDPAGNYTVLYRFSGGADGAGTAYGVALDANGNLYGSTRVGGTGACQDGNITGCGVVYRLDSAGNYTVLHAFSGGTDGSWSSGLTADTAGNLYGTAAEGGNLSACDGMGCGLVFKLDTAGDYTVLHAFSGGADGGEAAEGGFSGGVIRDAAGNLYGTTATGGTGAEGVVYSLDASSQETVLFNFSTSSAGGYYPQGGLAGDAAGNLYGTTGWGGVGTCNSGGGCGVLYKLDTNAHYSVLHSFTGGADGGVPNGVIRDPAGNLYGTTQVGGIVDSSGFSYGVVFKVDTQGHYSVLHSFVQETDGGGPTADVIRDPAGNLYGTVAGGPDYNFLGAVFKLDAAGNYTVLYAFTGGADGNRADTGVTRDAAGNLYGTTHLGGSNNYGVVYKLDAVGSFSTLHSFDNADGAYPNAVLSDSAGNLYGTTQNGGDDGGGVVYKLDTAGNYTVLHTFTGEADGAEPQTGVIQDPAGNLYGTSTLGNGSMGFVYKLDTAGDITVLYNLNGRREGNRPTALLRGPGGNLIGAAGGGTFGGGVVFALSDLP